MFGVEPVVGDLVVFNPPHYKGLVIGKCIGFTRAGLPKITFANKALFRSMATYLDDDKITEYCTPKTEFVIRNTIKSEEVMKCIEITADTNDADYVTERCPITDKEIELIKPVIQAIKDRSAVIRPGNGDDDYNWATFESLKEGKDPYSLYVKTGIITEEQFEAFYELVPQGDMNYSDGGIHTIASIVILHVSKEEILL